MNAAEVVGRTLAELGVRDAFGVLGSGNFIATQAMHASGVAFHHARHEGGAICMADGYARVSGRVGVCSVHQGPGFTNAMTGLTEAAKAHSRDLAKWDRISHYGSDGSNPWDRVKRAGYNAKVAAENVGTGQASLDEVIKGWQASPGHNKNLLLADVEHMGVALVQDPRTEFKTFWTLVVGASL